MEEKDIIIFKLEESQIRKLGDMAIEVLKCIVNIACELAEKHNLGIREARIIVDEIAMSFAAAMLTSAMQSINKAEIMLGRKTSRGN